MVVEPEVAMLNVRRVAEHDVNCSLGVERRSLFCQYCHDCIYYSLWLSCGVNTSNSRF